MDPRDAEEMLGCAARLAPRLPRYYFYCMGGAQEKLVRPVVVRAPGAVPVLVGVSPERLVQARDALLPVEAMGFVTDVFVPGWGRELPGPPALIGITALLGSVPDRKKEAFLQEAVAALAPAGILIWADLFLPQTLALYERYQAAEAEALCGLEPGLTMEAAIRRVADTQRVLYGSPVLLERAREMLFAAGCATVDIVWKRYGYAALVAAT